MTSSPARTSTRSSDSCSPRRSGNSTPASAPGTVRADRRRGRATAPCCARSCPNSPTCRCASPRSNGAPVHELALEDDRRDRGRRGPRRRTDRYRRGARARTPRQPRVPAIPRHRRGACDEVVVVSIDGDRLVECLTGPDPAPQAGRVDRTRPRADPADRRPWFVAEAIAGGARRDTCWRSTTAARPTTPARCTATGTTEWWTTCSPTRAGPTSPPGCRSPTSVATRRRTALRAFPSVSQREALTALGFEAWASSALERQADLLNTGRGWRGRPNVGRAEPGHDAGRPRGLGTVPVVRGRDAGTARTPHGSPAPSARTTH